MKFSHDKNPDDAIAKNSKTKLRTTNGLQKNLWKNQKQLLICIKYKRTDKFLYFTKNKTINIS